VTARPRVGRKRLRLPVRLVMAGMTLAGGYVAVPDLAGAQSLMFVRIWSETVTDGSPISLSSPNLATLPGGPAVVVGDQGGHVLAFELANGALVPGWPASTGGTPVDSTPSVAAVDPGSPNDTVFVGEGSPGAPHAGGYEAFRPNGTERWYMAVHNPGKTFKSGVVASLAIGDLQGGLDVVAPSIGNQEDALDAATGKVLPGFPWFTGDGDYSTPALADLYVNGATDIVNGGGQVAGIAFGIHFTQGGYVRVLLPTGNAGTNSPAGGLKCEYKPDQSVDSSAAVGRFLTGGTWGIVVGTGVYFPGATDTDDVLAVRANCKLAWIAHLDGSTYSSPALADLDGNGRLSAVEGTNKGHGQGSVYALSGTNGSVLWHQAVDGEVIGSVVTADLGGGYQDVVVASTGGAQVLDGRTGQVISSLETGVGLQNSALVTDDPNGTIGITLGGYNANDQGTVEHFELAGSDGADVGQVGSWPMFHHDPQLTGNAENVLPS
jgi:hypothetical protein